MAVAVAMAKATLPCKKVKWQQTAGLKCASLPLNLPTRLKKSLAMACGCGHGMWLWPWLVAVAMAYGHKA